MTDTRFPALAAAIDHMTPQQRHTTALALSDSTQPVLQALGVELMRANTTEERNFTEIEAVFHRQAAEDLAAPGAEILARLAADPETAATAADLEALESSALASDAAEAEQHAAERKAADLDAQLRPPIE